jgi:hypothetical protein
VPAPLEQPGLDRVRALDPKTNLHTPLRFALYCLYNPLFRREALKKQGMRLGLE